VKVAGRDVLATWKILVSAGLAPILYIFYSVLAGFTAAQYGFTYKYRLWAPFMTMAALPFFGYSALKFGEAGSDVFKCVIHLKKEVAGSVLNAVQISAPPYHRLASRAATFTEQAQSNARAAITRCEQSDQ
jgi:hypothetical protein